MNFTLNPLVRKNISEWKLESDEAIGSKIIPSFPLVQENAVFSKRDDAVMAESNPEWSVVEKIENWRKSKSEILEGNDNLSIKPPLTKDGFIKI